uniref:protein-tyrosine-phosphatase n=1 Tax=Scleropages formosus TaxID=113540 RepID=A0A8C9R8H6_SCLFO
SPDFLPQKQYLRIPIDDSLRDDLLPWIPEALRFIGELSLPPVSVGRRARCSLIYAPLTHLPAAVRDPRCFVLRLHGAMSLGCSVLVHCAAGVSRSPALAVAYVMYRLGLCLDDAFVKERRPTISPNFNFLGQLQETRASRLSLVRSCLSAAHFQRSPRDAWTGARARFAHDTSGAEPSKLASQIRQRAARETLLEARTSSSFAY